MAKTPLSDDTAILVVDKLKDQEFVQSLVDELRKVFKVSQAWSIDPMEQDILHWCMGI